MRAVNSFKYIFTSSVRLSLIQSIFYSPKEMFFTRQLGRLLATEINAIRRELLNLKKAGLITIEKRGYKTFHQANIASPLFEDFLRITHKTSGLGGMFHAQKDKLGKLSRAYFSQSYIKNTEKTVQVQEVDILIIGEVIMQELEELVKTEEGKRGQELNYMVMTDAELSIRKQKRDPFIVDFFLKEPMLIFSNT